MAAVTVVCVCRSGGDFAPEHVGRLRDHLRGAGAWAGPIVCLADRDDVGLAGVLWRTLEYRWHGWWSKLEVCSPAQSDLGDVLYCDLDVDVVGPIAELTTVEGLTVAREPGRPRRINSSLMFLPPATRRLVWQAWWRMGPEVAMRRFGRGGGDQRFLEYALTSQTVMRWDEVRPGRVVFRAPDVMVSPETRIVCYQRSPRPWEIPA